MRFCFKDFGGEKMLWLVWRLGLESHRDENIVSTVASQTMCKLLGEAEATRRQRSWCGERKEKRVGSEGSREAVEGDGVVTSGPFLIPWIPFLLWVLSCVLTINPLGLEQVSVPSSQEKFYLQGHFQIVKDLRSILPCNLELKRLLEVEQKLQIK